MTVMELMVAVMILAIVVSAAFGVAFSIMNSYREHRRAMGVERSARGAMSVLVEALRSSSPGMRNGQITDLVGCEADLDSIRIENHADAPDAIDVIYASGGIVTSLRAGFDQSSTDLAVEDALLLQPQDQVLVTDFEKAHLLTIESVTQAGSDWILTVKGGAPETLCPPLPPFSYLPRSTVMRAQRARFTVDTTQMPVLYMDPDGPGDAFDRQAVAEGIEDLQVAIGVDVNGSGAIEEEVGLAGNDDDWVHNHPDDTELPALAVSPYRAVRLTVIGRSVDDTGQAVASVRPEAEDRAAAAVGDVFRRRSLSTTVELRNLEGSP
jgi:type II secretory pathway pseudopilin PulG